MIKTFRNVSASATFILIIICKITFSQEPMGKIIFSSFAFSSGEISESQLHIINSDGTEDRQITHSGKFNNCPSIFRNRLLFRQTDESKKEYNILISNLFGEKIKPIILHKDVCNPRWKSDGKLIAYEYYAKKSREIWVMDSLGNNKHRLIANAQHPYWSFDNKKILFTRDYEVYILNLENGSYRKLTDLKSKGITAKWPAISSNGKKIAFVGYFGENPRRFGVFVTDLEGKENQIILENCSMPFWTHDDNYIVCSYIGKDDKDSQIVMINIETRNKTYITHNSNRNDEPVWFIK